MTPFLSFLNGIQPLPPNILELINGITEPLYLNRNDTLFTRGKIVHRLCFVETGTLAAYRPSSERLIPTRFWFAGQMMFLANMDKPLQIDPSSPL